MMLEIEKTKVYRIPLIANVFVLPIPLATYEKDVSKDVSVKMITKYQKYCLSVGANKTTNPDPAKVTIHPSVTIERSMLSISFRSTFLSKRKRRVASAIESVITGRSKDIVVIKTSATPYSEVVKYDVYKDIKKKDNSFVPKLPMANIPVSLARCRYLFSSFLI